MTTPIEALLSSHYNLDEATREIHARQGDLKLNDVTLRDGEQSVDVAFNVHQKHLLVERMAEMHVHQAQVGFSYIDGVETAKLVKKSGYDILVEVLCVGFRDDWKEQIDRSYDAGVDSILLVIRSKDDALKLNGFTRQTALDFTQEAVEYAVSKKAGAITVMPTFSTNAELSFLKTLVRTAVDAGASRIWLADSAGVAKPAAVGHLVREIKATVPVPIGLHCHNDFGLAVACTLAGLEAGAEWADVTVNGLGERGGNTSFEETVMALKCLYGADLGIDTTQLKRLSDMVVGMTNVGIATGKPVVGRNAFAHQLDIHALAFERQPDLFEPYDPALVGHSRTLDLGKGTGPYAVGTKLNEFGISLPELSVQQLARRINEMAVERHAIVSDDEFLTMAHEIAER